MLPFTLAWSAAILDWGTVTPADIHCPALWLIGSENDKAMESLNQYKEEISASKVQVQNVLPPVQVHQTLEQMWESVFSLANAFMEELWFRGIFLKHFEPLLGINGSVWLTSIIFGLMHGMAFYFTPAVLPFFVVNTLALGPGCGYLMMKSDGIWGATLIHAAADFFLFIAVLANA